MYVLIVCIFYKELVAADEKKLERRIPNIVGFTFHTLHAHGGKKEH